MTHVWDAEFAAIGTVEQWNVNVIPWMKDRGDEYKRHAHAEAKRRGYQFDRDKMEYVHPWDMSAAKGVNLIACGWRDGVLRCIFATKNGNSVYMFGDAANPVPKETSEKLLKSPYPDKLFAQIVKGKYSFFKAN